MSIILNYCNHCNAYEQEGKRNRNDKKPHLSETHTVSFPSLVIDQNLKDNFHFSSHFGENSFYIVISGLIEPGPVASGTWLGPNI